MRKISLFFALSALCFLLSGCGSREPSVLGELSGRENCVVYIEEGSTGVPYLVLDKREGNVLLLRRDVMSDSMSISDYSSVYENSMIDNYLSGEYLELLEEDVSALICPVRIEVAAKDARYREGKDTYTITRKAFLLSYTEAGFTELSMSPVEGERLSVFSSDSSRAALREGEPCGWWLRTPYTVYDSVTWAVTPEGVKTELSSAEKYGVRPAFYLPENTGIAPAPDGSAAYVIE